MKLFDQTDRGGLGMNQRTDIGGLETLFWQGLRQRVGEFHQERECCIGMRSGVTNNLI